MSIYRVRTTWTGQQGLPGFTNHYFEAAAGTAQAAADAVRDFWQAIQGQQVLGINWSTGTEVATLNENDGSITSISAVTERTGGGTSVNDPLPFATQGLIRWRTGQFTSGREIRGRTFVPGLTEINSNGKPSGALVTVFNNAGAGLIANAGSKFGVWSRGHGLWYEAVSSSGWSEYAVLRSRRD